MKFFIPYFIAILGLLLAAPASAFAKVNVFACTPEWASLSKEIGGDLIEVYTATNAQQDVHHIRAKPSLLAAMRKADIVFCSGASLESGWLPILIQKAGGPDVQQNTIGWLMASDYVEKLEVMEHADRSMGHVHPEGNPHVHLNPNNILKIAKVFADRLYLIDQINGLSYKANLSVFKNNWQNNISSWEEAAASLKGSNVVVYHKSWAYLAEWLDINIIASLEPKPGLPPTTSHLEKVLQSLNDKNVRAILVAPFENDKAANWLSERTNIPVLYLPYTVGGSSNASTLKNLFDETLAMLDKSSQ
jgi:zinc/manganese transport system substrate-binding protein